MKVLLINPPYSYHNPWLQIAEPLGIMYLASYVCEYSDHQTTILDCLANDLITKESEGRYWYGLSIDSMLEEIEKYDPEIIGITCMFSKKKGDFLLSASNIRKRFPDKKIVAGGTYPSLFPRETIETGVIDYVLIGEAEETFLELLDSLRSGAEDLHRIEGIAFKNGEEFVVTDKKHYITDLDKIPFPARNLLNYESYVKRKSVLHGIGLKKSASILTSRSCPNRCNFCSMFKVHGPKWRGRSSQNVIDEILFLHHKYDVREFFIMDDNFTLKKSRVKEICLGIIKSGIKIRWNTPNGISINTLDKDLLALMKKSGCCSICIAIESGDEEIRNNTIGKKLKDSKIKEISEAASQLGLYVVAFYIIGMPGETEEKFQKTLEHLRRYPFNAVAAAFANPLPGTKLYQDCIDNKWEIIQQDQDSNNVFYSPYIVTPEFSVEELLDREKRFYRVFLTHRFLTLIKDTILFKNKLLHYSFLMRILKDRILRSS